jgi:hypothetical protein
MVYRTIAITNHQSKDILFYWVTDSDENLWRINEDAAMYLTRVLFIGQILSMIICFKI